MSAAGNAGSEGAAPDMNQAQLPVNTSYDIMDIVEHGPSEAAHGSGETSMGDAGGDGSTNHGIPLQPAESVSENISGVLPSENVTGGGPGESAPGVNQNTSSGETAGDSAPGTGEAVNASAVGEAAPPPPLPLPAANQPTATTAILADEYTVHATLYAPSYFEPAHPHSEAGLLDAVHHYIATNTAHLLSEEVIYQYMQETLHQYSEQVMEQQHQQLLLQSQQLDLLQTQQNGQPQGQQLHNHGVAGQHQQQQQQQVHQQMHQHDPPQVHQQSPPHVHQQDPPEVHGGSHPLIPPSVPLAHFLQFYADPEVAVAGYTVPQMSQAMAPLVGPQHPPASMLPGIAQFFSAPGNITTNGNLNPTNMNLKAFTMNWAMSARAPPFATHTRAPDIPNPESVEWHFSTTPKRIYYSSLDGDQCDFQGINWESMGTTRSMARERRRRMFTNYVSVEGSDRWVPKPNELMPANSDTYFRFYTMHMKKSVNLPHFQLRNLLATASRSRMFYAERKNTVRMVNAMSGSQAVALRFSGQPGIQISTIAAGQGALVAGGFGGEYCIANIDAQYVDEKAYRTRAEGTVTNNKNSGISNHIQIHNLRSLASPLAAFSSNDLGLRVLDLNTQVLLSDTRFMFPLNCTAISPDRRLRVVVGDNMSAYIVAADPERSVVDSNGIQRPDVLQRLDGHNDYGFACAWADDGYTVATGNQDRAVKIWDARRWCDSRGISSPVYTLRTEMSGARSLHFSPAGSGKRVLVVAEEADIISVLDAQTFASRQTLDLFGEIAGISMANNGRDLFALCADPQRGGIARFVRCGVASATGNLDEGFGLNARSNRRRRSATYDWPDGSIDSDYTAHQRALRRHVRSSVVASVDAF